LAFIIRTVHLVFVASLNTNSRRFPAGLHQAPHWSS